MIIALLLDVVELHIDNIELLNELEERMDLRENHSLRVRLWLRKS